ncbi:unnamed protein product [Urochloa humidicola]
MQAEDFSKQSCMLQSFIIFLKPKSLILSGKQVPDCKQKNLAYRAPCSSLLSLFFLLNYDVFEYVSTPAQTKHSQYFHVMLFFYMIT